MEGRPTLPQWRVDAQTAGACSLVADAASSASLGAHSLKGGRWVLYRSSLEHIGLWTCGQLPRACPHVHRPCDDDCCAVLAAEAHAHSHHLTRRYHPIAAAGDAVAGSNQTARRQATDARLLTNHDYQRATLRTLELDCQTKITEAALDTLRCYEAIGRLLS